MNSLARVMKTGIIIPDFAQDILTKALESGRLVIVDSTGLKVYGKEMIFAYSDHYPTRPHGVATENGLHDRDVSVAQR